MPRPLHTSLPPSKTKTCSQGRTIIDCPNEKVKAPPTVYERTFYGTRSISDTSPTRVKIPYARAFHEVISISSHVKISMISLISSLSYIFVLKFVGVSSKHLRSSSKVFGNLRQSMETFGIFRKFSENVLEHSCGLRNNFRKSSEISGKWSKIFEKSSKTPSSVYLCNKKSNTR